MQVYVFRGRGQVFAMTQDSAGGNLPAEYGPWNQHKILDMERAGEPRPGVNTGECLDDIEQYGFHLTDAHVRITESAVKNP